MTHAPSIRPRGIGYELKMHIHGTRKLSYWLSDMSSPMKIGAESMELPLGPITRARAKKFQDVVASYIARLWSDGLIAHKTPSSTSLIRNFLQADFSLCQLNLAQFGT